MRLKAFSNFIKTERTLLAVIGLAYLVVGIFLLNRFVGNPDQVSYISVAQKYLAGQFHDAVNGYWSPLYCWLMVPWLAIRMNAVMASQVVSLLSGLWLVLGTYAISRRIRLSTALRMMAALIVAALALFCFAFIAVGPDLLAASLIAFYLAVLLDPDFVRKKSSGPLCAVLGALGYLSKAYAFYFFIAHFMIYLGILFFRIPRRDDRMRLARKAVFSLGLFLVLSGPWIAALSVKYGRPIIGTSGAINLDLIGPQSRGQAQTYIGFIAPPNPTALFSWEDPNPSYYFPWSPLRSAQDFGYWVGVLIRNLWELAKIFWGFSVLSLPLIALAAGVTGSALVKNKAGGFPLFAILAMAVYSSGYIALNVLDRYMIIDLVLIVLLGVFGLDILFRRRVFSSRFSRAAVIVVFGLTFLPMPMKFFPKVTNHAKNFLIEDLGYTDESVYRIAQALQRRYRLSGHIASNYNPGVTLYISYYLNLRDFGWMRKDEESEELRRDLEKFGIDYFSFGSKTEIGSRS